jgi:Type II secretion system (T2SS), protein L
MSTLRVLLDAVPDADRADAWALFDDEDRLVQRGRDGPESWPAAERRVAVLAASCVRVIGLKLPPLTPDRVAAAAAFALEDRLAGPANEQHIAVSPQQRDGTVEAIVASRAVIAALSPSFDRVLAEPALAPRPGERRWRWYASQAGGGFVRKPDGSAFATSEVRGLPAELSLALDHAARADNGPAEVAIAFDVDATSCQTLAEEARVAMVVAENWRWDEAGSAAFATATDLRQGEFATAVPTTANASARVFRIAAIVAAMAIALHIVATVGEWVAVRVDDWRTRSALGALAREAGVASAEDPAAGIARLHAAARHRAGLAAAGDAVPMLARAAPALATLPFGTLKTATYGDGYWTFDLTKPDAGVTTRLAHQLNDAGLTTLEATNASGTRLRVALAPGAQ